MDKRKPPTEDQMRQWSLRDWIDYHRQFHTGERDLKDRVMKRYRARKARKQSEPF